MSSDPAEARAPGTEFDRLRADQACERYRHLVEAAHDWVWEVDEAGVYTFVGPQVVDLLGYAPEEVVGRQPFDLMPPDEAARVRALFTAIAAQQQPFRALENVNVHRDGHLVVLETNGVPFFDVAGRCAGYRGMDRDITERVRDREALRQSEERFAKAFHASPDAININRLSDGLYIDVNPGFLALTGYRREEVIGRSSLEINLWARPEDRAALVNALLRERAVDNLEACFRLKDGSLRLGLMSARIITLQNEEHILSVTRDIHDRKRAERALQASEQRFRRITESITDLVAEIDRDARFRYVSPSFRLTLGLEPASLIGASAFEGIHPDDLAAVHVAYSRALSLSVGKGVEYRYRHADGHWVWLQTSGRTLTDLEGQPDGFVLATRDISERKQAEAERAALQDQLIQVQKMESVGRLAGGVAHDFNNMLGVILGHVELALKDADPALSLYADLREIKDAAERSANLTRQLLGFARKQTVARRILDLNEAVGGTLPMLARMIGESIDLRWRPAGTPLPVNVDPGQIDQVLTNLCINARDAIAGTGTVTIETRRGALDAGSCASHPGVAPGDYALLAVGDDGSGMDGETQSRLFEPYFTTKDIGRGTGLGLATVYGIVKQNLGFIDVRSEPGRGTTFTLYLPLAAPTMGTAADALERSAALSNQPDRRGGETILLVEDERAILSLARRILESKGYTVLGAGTPAEALRTVAAHAGDIHLLMTDVVMPEMNGRDLADRVAARHPRIRRLFMSGYTADVIASHGVLEAGVRFVQKPFSVTDLANRVREALDGES